MEETAKERCLLIKSIDDECNKSFSSFEILNDVIQVQENRIKQLECELKHKENINKTILIENAKYSIKLLSTLLNIIWPLTTKQDFQQNIISNDNFIDILFDNLQSAISPSLLYPLLGILANLNSNDTLRSKIGFKSVFIIVENDISKVICNNECKQVFLYLLYNVSFDNSLILDILVKCSLLKSIKENLQQIAELADHRNLLFKFLWRITNAIISNISIEILQKKNLLFQIQSICNCIPIIKYRHANEINDQINNYLMQIDS